MDTYNISEDLLNKVIINLINPESIINSENKEVIVKILLKELSKHSVEQIIHLTLTEDYYEPLAINDHFKMKPIRYDISKQYEPDVLRDMGLSDDEDNVYGYVTGDASWSSTDYNPFYRDLKVNLYYHDADLQIKLIEKNASPLELIKINKLDIPYFNKPVTEQPTVNQLTLELM
jgi:hypothetical protein